MRTLPFVQQYVDDHPELESHLLNIRESPEYWDLFTAYKEAFSTGAIPVPSLFVGDRVLVGYDEITGSLDGVVKEQSTGLHAQVPYVPAIGNLSAQELTIPLVITAGLADGINPCAFSVLIILLVTLSVAGSRRRMVVVGTCFIASVFVFYFLSGLGIFMSSSLPGSPGRSGSSRLQSRSSSGRSVSRTVSSAGRVPLLRSRTRRRGSSGSTSRRPRSWLHLPLESWSGCSNSPAQGGSTSRSSP